MGICSSKHKSIINKAPPIPSKLKNLFLLGQYNGRCENFIKFYSDDSKNEGRFFTGTLRTMGTKMWTYIGTEEYESNDWKELLHTINGNYLVAICFPFGERFATTSIHEYLNDMNKIFDFNRVDLIMTGGLNHSNCNYDQFVVGMMKYGSQVCQIMSEWFPNGKFTYWISGVNLYNNFPPKMKTTGKKGFVVNEMGKLIHYIRYFEK